MISRSSSLRHQSGHFMAALLDGSNLLRYRLHGMCSPFNRLHMLPETGGNFT
ncbi:hypothetical protein D3C74_369480 [compost metagenome]